jgi:hypothetical protein
MKYTLLILLSGLFLCGCSKKPAIDLVQSGTDTTWGGSVLHVTKRDGTSLEGVRITLKLPNGDIQEISADTAVFSPAPVAKDTVILILHNAKLHSSTYTADLGEHQIQLGMQR